MFELPYYFLLCIFYANEFFLIDWYSNKLPSPYKTYNKEYFKKVSIVLNKVVIKWEIYPNMVRDSDIMTFSSQISWKRVLNVEQILLFIKYKVKEALCFLENLHLIKIFVINDSETSFAIESYQFLLIFNPSCL